MEDLENGYCMVWMIMVFLILRLGRQLRLSQTHFREPEERLAQDVAAYDKPGCNSERKDGALVAAVFGAAFGLGVPDSWLLIL